jgi:hypothetical protein
MFECYPETRFALIVTALSRPTRQFSGGRRTNISRQSETAMRALTEFRSARGDAINSGIKPNNGEHCLDRPADNTSKYCLADDYAEFPPEDARSDHNKVFKEQT